MNDEIWIGIAMIVSLAIALSLHEWAHALVATWRGDTTARMKAGSSTRSRTSTRS